MNPIDVRSEIEDEDRVRELLRAGHDASVPPFTALPRSAPRPQFAAAIAAALLVIAIVAIPRVLPSLSPKEVAASPTPDAFATVPGGFVPAGSCPVASYTPSGPGIPPLTRNGGINEPGRGTAVYSSKDGGSLRIEVRSFQSGLPLSSSERAMNDGVRQIHFSYRPLIPDTFTTSGPAVLEAYEWWVDGPGPCQIGYVAWRQTGASQDDLRDTLISIGRTVPTLRAGAQPFVQPRTLGTTLAGVRLGMTEAEITAVLGAKTADLPDAAQWGQLDQSVIVSFDQSTPRLAVQIAVSRRDAPTQEGFRVGDTLASFRQVYRDYPVDDEGINPGFLLAVHGSNATVRATFANGVAIGVIVSR